MKRRLFSAGNAFGCVLVAFVILVSASSSAAAQQPRRRPSPVAPKQPPMTVNEVARVLELLAEKVVSEQRAIDGIRTRGIGFAATEANLNIIRSKNPPPAVLAFILSLAAPAPVVKPAPPAGKDLIVYCAPAECSISLNGTQRGTTQGGRLKAEGQPFGRLVVQAAKDGYIGGEQIVPWSQESPPEVHVRLEPARETKLRFGKAIAADMMTKLAGTAKCDLTATGAASVWSEDGGVAEYNLTVAFGASGLAQFDLSAEQGSVVFQCRGTELCAVKPPGRFRFGGPKKLPEDKLQAVATNLRLFRRYHMCALVDRLLAPDVTALAVDSGSAELNLVSPEGAYGITLDAQRRPVEVSYTSTTGVGSGIQLTYGDYTTVGSVSYPRRTVIRLPGTKTAGIQVRLQTIQSGANLRDSDFRRQ